MLTWHHTEPEREGVNRWRVDDAWRRVPISRTYYTDRMPTALLEVYRDDRAGDWHLQRMIDWRRVPGGLNASHKREVGYLPLGDQVGGPSRSIC